MPHKSQPLKGAARDRYLDLVREFPLVTIRSDAQLADAIEMLDSLTADGEPRGGQAEYVEVLGDLIAAYEDEHHPIDPASDADMLRHLLESKGVSQAELSREASIAKSTVSEVLAGKKRFSKKMIGKLSKFFGVERSVLAANVGK